MPVQAKFLPLVGLLALVPAAVYATYRPEVGAVLSVLSIVLILSTLWLMLRPERTRRGKEFGA